MAYRKTYLEDVLTSESPIEKKCPKGKAGKDCRREKLKGAGRKLAVAAGGATLIHLGMGGYKKGDGDWVKKEGPIQKICPPGKNRKACKDAKKKKKERMILLNLQEEQQHYSNIDFTDDKSSKKKVIKKICPIGPKRAECIAKKKHKNAWSFKSKKGRHLRGNI